jgi:predicted ester cyclase
MPIDDLIAGWRSAWSGRDPTAFADLCDANAQYEDPLTDGPLVGAAALGEHAARLWRGLPDARLESSGASVHDGAFVAAPCRLAGTHTELLAGLPPTGRFVSVQCLFYCELSGDLLRRVRGFFDLYDAAVQLGVLPARNTLGEKALLMLRGYGLRAGE